MARQIEGMYVGGGWAATAKTFPDYNPSDGSVWANIPDAGVAETRAAIEAAQSADTLVYTMRALSPLVAFSPGGRLRATISNPLKSLAQNTGGRAFGTTRNAPETFETIEKELRNLYVIGFTPPDEARNGKFHKLEIKTQTKGLKVRARKGYTIHR